MVGDSSSPGSEIRSTGFPWDDPADGTASPRRFGPSMTIPLETERLMFRDWTATDLEPFHSICADPSVMKFVGDGVPWSLERTEEFIVRAGEMSRTLEFCRWPVIYKPGSAVIGFCGFVPASDGAEIGWRLAKASWGQGLATEAARAVLRHGFEILGFQRIIATVQSLNRASIRVVEKLGMKAESSFHRNGREVVLFSINNEENKVAGTRPVFRLGQQP